MSRSVRSVILLSLCLLAVWSAGVVRAESAPDLLLILDASGSMWGQIDGENKIVIARRVLKDLVGGLAEDAEVGLVNVFAAGTGEAAAASRTYKSPKTNPSVFRITAGDYDVEVGSVEISGKPTHRFSGVTVAGGGRAERAHDFASGTLRLGAVLGGELVDVTVSVASVDTGQSVAQGRTYTSERSNPKTFELTPGKYRVRLKAVKLEGGPVKELEVMVEAGKTVERTVDFGS